MVVLGGRGGKLLKYLQTYSCGLKMTVSRSFLPDSSEAEMVSAVKTAREEFLAGRMLSHPEVMAYRSRDVLENGMPLQNGSLCNGRAFAPGLINSLSGSPISYHGYSPLPLNSYLVDDESREMRMPLSELSRAGAFPKERIPPCDSSRTIPTEYMRTITDISANMCHATIYAPKEGAAEEARSDMHYSVASGPKPVVPSIRNNHYFSCDKVAKEEERTSSEDEISQHFEPTNTPLDRKGLISPQSPQKSDCQPNSPTESSSSKNARISQSSSSLFTKSPTDPKACNWKKYKFIVLNSLNQSTKQDSTDQNEMGTLSPRTYMPMSTCQQSMEPEHLNVQSPTKMSVNGEDSTIPQASRLNNIVNR